ncbi:MAG: flagellar hook capping FlgD N-terminal domain-containing protein [Planctomycetota bacterium]
MSQIQNNSSLTFGAAGGQSADAFAGLDTQSFLDLMIAELQNQDPLNPAENEQLLNQIYQIRQIESNDALTNTLDSILLGQNVSSATNLIGADVVALTDDGERVSGNVRKVTIDGTTPRLDLAVDVGAEQGSVDGGLASGQYVYEVVWEDEGGTQFSVEVAANTAGFADFSGSVRLTNLPPTDSLNKRVYRTDATGQGERQLVAELPGVSTGFTDTTADAARGETLTGPRQQLTFARKATVSLSNISEVTPPQ